MLNFFKKNKERELSHKWTLSVGLVGGLLGLLASFVLSVEKFHLYENPGTVLSCDFSVLFNCSTVMQTWQSAVFGFPNMFIGLIAYAVVVTVAVLMLSRVTLPKILLKVANAGYLLGAIFAYWLLFQSMYVIEVLCPWCLVVTFATTIIFSSMTHYNLKENTFGFSKKRNNKIQKFLDKGYHQLLVASWFVIIIALMYIKFAYN